MTATPKEILLWTGIGFAIGFFVMTQTGRDVFKTASHVGSRKVQGRLARARRNY